MKMTESNRGEKVEREIDAKDDSVTKKEARDNFYYKEENKENRGRTSHWF